jgi:mRNA-degrading endonuclease toxin of MazEF toxin-antitoxin module
MPARHWLAALTTIGCLAASGEIAAGNRLALTVTPNVSNAPTTLTVLATVARDAGNRWLHVEADSGGFYRSSAIQLDGDRAPLVTEIHLRNLPSGDYTVAARLRNHLGEDTIVRRRVVVLSRYGEP